MHQHTIDLENAIEAHPCCNRFLIMPDKYIVHYPKGHVPDFTMEAIVDGQRTEALKKIWAKIESHRLANQEDFK